MGDETKVLEKSEFTQLDEKLYELQTLFDLSKTLNSSIKNLRTILDTLLLTPMGKLLITRGMVLLHKGEQEFVIETLKGLPKALQGQKIQIEDCPGAPVFVSELEPSTWRAFFVKNDIELLIPVQHDNREVGLIGFSKKTMGREYNDSELDYLFSLSNIAATAIQNGLILQERNEVNRRLQKKVQELNTVFEISQEVNSPPLEIGKVQNLLAYSIMGEMMVRGVLIYLVMNGDLILTMNKGFNLEVNTVLDDKEFIQSLLQLKKPTMISDDPEREFFARLQDAGIAVLLPMRIQNETKGVIALGEKINKDRVTNDEMDFLTTLGNLAINSIENARLFEEEKEKERLEEELTIARDIQRQLLPDACPIIENYEVAAINLSSRQVGGDYYDCIKLKDNKYVFCIADVSGKATPAALLMANLQASLHALIDTNLTLPEIASRINKLIYRNTSYDKFITFFIGVLDLDTGNFNYVNAGHNPPYVFHADRSFDTLQEGGLILGMMPEAPYESASVTLEAGDLIVMFTDGVSEAMNQAEEEFEEKRIEACIRENFELNTEEILQNLITSVKKFSEGTPQSDDITVLLVKAMA